MCLRGCPTLLVLEKQGSASGQQLFLGVPFASLFGIKALSHSLLSSISLFDGFPSVGNSHLLNSLVNQLMDMKTVSDQQCFGKASAYNSFRAGSHIRSHFLDFPSLAFRQFSQHTDDPFPVSSFNHVIMATEAPFLPFVALLVSTVSSP